MTPVATPPINFLNVSYFFQLIYNVIFFFHGNGTGTGTGNSLAGLAAIASAIWLVITLFAYLISLACIGALVYFSTRLYQTAREEELKYLPIPKEVADTQLEHSRWNYIRQLIESPQESDWRQAIIEADIMLEELLTKLGYVGNGIGEQLQGARFNTLQDAWDAHKVRNDIAHQGSAFQLSDQLAYRTIGHYENVFREFNEI